MQCYGDILIELIVGNVNVACMNGMSRKYKEVICKLFHKNHHKIKIIYSNGKCGRICKKCRRWWIK